MHESKGKLQRDLTWRMGGWGTLRPSPRLLVWVLWRKTKSCGGSALEDGAWRIVRRQVATSFQLASRRALDARTVGLLPQGSATCKKQTGIPGLRITIVTSSRSSRRTVPSTVLSEFSSKLERNQDLCVRRPRGLGKSHAPDRRPHTTSLLHDNRKPVTKFRKWSSNKVITISN